MGIITEKNIAPDIESLGFKDHFNLLLKRLIALPSKMAGFKPFCLYLATYLLVNGFIGQWVWLSVLMMVLFGIVGLKVAGSILTAGKYRGGDEKAD